MNSNHTHPDYDSPAFQITIDDQDITGKLAPRLICLTLTECGSDESDQLDITLSDHDGKLVIPSLGAQIHLQLGWAKSVLTDKGIFTVDEAEHSGAPDQLILRARTVNFTASFRQVQTQTFHDTTLGHIIDIIAFKNALQPGISEQLRNVVIHHIDQTRESDAAFLRRLGKKFDAIATVKNNTLLFIPINSSHSANGQRLPTITLTRNQGDNHRYHSAERDSYTGVRAYWHDTHHAIHRSVIAGAAGNSKRLRTTYATESDARQAAIAEWQRIRRGLATFEMTLARGNPQLIPKSPVKVTGFKPVIDAVEWQAIKVCHTLSKSGFITLIEMETRTEEEDAERENETDPDEGITGVIARWRDRVSKKSGMVIAPSTGKGRQRQPTTNASINPKMLNVGNGHKDVYESHAGARRAADLAWAKIIETRAIIDENNVELSGD